MDKRYFSDKIVEWYLENKRDLPWRNDNDPYKIWLSEIILQQTRVAQGLPYYEKFIQRFPDVHLLARASEQEVLRLWQGLGYYTRARNLHQCAREVATKFNGKFPERYTDLKMLRGIGDYTAAAIASIAFKEPVAVVDGNVFRVLARVFGIDKETGQSTGKKLFTELANQLLNSDRPDIHNQAVMEFGALHCVPHQPACAGCIFERSCVANLRGMQKVLPVKSKARETRRRYFYYFVIRQGKSFALKRRDQKDIWHGLYDFYLVEKKRQTRPEKIMNDDSYLKRLGPFKNNMSVSGYYKHVLSHQTILAKFVVIEPDRKKPVIPEPLRFFSKRAILDLPKPVLISRFLHDFTIL